MMNNYSGNMLDFYNLYNKDNPVIKLKTLCNMKQSDKDFYIKLSVCPNNLIFYIKSGNMAKCKKINFTCEQINAICKYIFDITSQYATKATRENADFKFYRKVKDNTIFKSYYKMDNYQFNYMDKSTGDIIVKEDYGAPCRGKDCGNLIYPIHAMHVDHQRPQAGGGDKAILKVFRSLDMGLTVAGPTGGKARVYSVAAKGAVPNYAWTGRNTCGNKKDRYTLSEKGIIIYNFLLDYSESKYKLNSPAEKQNMKNKLQAICMNHVANLKLLCAFCNTKKGDK